MAPSIILFLALRWQGPQDQMATRSDKSPVHYALVCPPKRIVRWLWAWQAGTS